MTFGSNVHVETATLRPRRRVSRKRTPPCPARAPRISKSFGGVRVLNDVNLRLDAGEVVGLLGDNGAGKSTLIKIVTGVHGPDAGESCSMASPCTTSTSSGPSPGHRDRLPGARPGRAAAIWRNIFMGRPISGRFGFLKVGEMREITSRLMGESMGFTSAALTPDTPVTGLSGGERQGLAIVRALHFEADIIILDEPTMGLSLKETEKLLHFVDGIRAAGKSCDLHRPQHLPCLLGRRPDRRPRPRARGRRVPHQPLHARRADEHHARGGRHRSLHPRPSATGRAPTRRAGSRRVNAVAQRRRSTRRAARSPRSRGPGRRRSASRSPSSCSGAGVHRPGPGDLPQRTHLPSFAQTTPYFAITAMALTMVIVAGDIDLSFPSIMALGMVGFVWRGRTPPATSDSASRRPRRRRPVRPVQRRGRDPHRDPVAGRDDRHAVPLPRADARPHRGLDQGPRGDEGVAGPRPPRWGLVRDTDGVLVAGPGRDRGLVAAQPAPPRPERLHDRRQPPRGDLDGHPDPPDADHPVRARGSRGRLCRGAQQPPGRELLSVNSGEATCCPPLRPCSSAEPRCSAGGEASTAPSSAHS